MRNKVIQHRFQMGFQIVAFRYFAFLSARVLLQAHEVPHAKTPTILCLSMSRTRSASCRKFSLKKKEETTLARSFIPHLRSSFNKHLSSPTMCHQVLGCLTHEKRGLFFIWGVRTRGSAIINGISATDAGKIRLFFPPKQMRGVCLIRVLLLNLQIERVLVEH